MELEPSAALELQAALIKIKHLETALLSNRRIGMATGIVMSRYGLTAEGAFQALVARSQRTNRAVRLLAEDVIEAGNMPREPVDADPGARRASAEPREASSRTQPDWQLMAGRRTAVAPQPLPMGQA